MIVNDRASIAARVIMAIIRSRIGAVFKGHPTTTAQGEIEAFLRGEFSDVGYEAVLKFRSENPGT
jgi:hypothetical protein